MFNTARGVRNSKNKKQ